MRVALDYDNTYTLDPPVWNGIIREFQQWGHEVRIVTFRHQLHDNIDYMVNGLKVIYTDGVAKKFFCHHMAVWDPDVWIDDKPENIINNGVLTQQEIHSWRMANK